MARHAEAWHHTQFVRGKLAMLVRFCKEQSAGAGPSRNRAGESGIAPAQKMKWAVFTIFGLALLASASTRQSGGQEASALETGLKKAAAPSNSQEGPEVAMGPIHLSHSGRLPVSLQGFKLGMPLREAVALFNSPDAPKDLQQAIFGSYPMTNRILVNIRPYRGRVIQITATAENLSPDYADFFESKVFAQLGRPDAEIYEENMLVPTRRYIWVDQDVRIAFEHVEGKAGETTLRVTLVAFPTSLLILEGVTSLTESAEQEWGAKPKPNPYGPGIASASVRFEKQPSHMESAVPHYKPAPATNGSFFLSSDFDDNQTR
jgi:hypothetical protein